MQKVLLIGATSAIAEACARLYAARGAALYLIARDGERLAMIARDLKMRGAVAVSTDSCDFAAMVDAAPLVARAQATLGGFDLVLIAHGVLPDQAACEQDLAQLREVFEVNTLSTLVLLTYLANTLIAQEHGTLAVMSSVAGDRGRQSNYVYGASKAALDVFLAGLRNRLARHGVHVLTVKAGFVDTPMTAQFVKGALWARPDTVARGIVRAIESHRDIVYLPWFWQPIMAVIRAIPERVFKRLKL